MMNVLHEAELTFSEDIIEKNRLLLKNMQFITSHKRNAKTSTGNQLDHTKYFDSYNNLINGHDEIKNLYLAHTKILGQTVDK